MRISAADLAQLQKEVAEQSFAEFVKMAWPVLEPGTPYKPNWHMDCIGEHLQAVADGELNRVLFNIPPGTMKSNSVSVFFPAWLWGPRGLPHYRFIGAAHEQTLATRDNRRTRLLVESDWFRSIWPIKLTTDQNEKTYFENEQRGFRQSSAVASMTGKRGNCLTGDTLVATDAGQIAIKDIVDAALSCNVLSYAAHSGKLVYRPIEAVARRPETGLYRVSTAGGRVVRCTGDHRFYTARGYVEARLLSEGDIVLSALCGGVRQDREASDPSQGFGALRGLFVDVGTVDAPHRFRCLEQRGVESRDPVRCMSHGSSQRGAQYPAQDRVSVVERLCESEVVYDIQVADTRCFFAGGVLVHNCVVWDDPQNPESSESELQRDTATRIFSETLPTRVVDPISSAIIIMMQRLHQTDVSGHILASGLGYQHVMLPMEFEPERRCYSVVRPAYLDAEPVQARYEAYKQHWHLEDEIAGADRIRLAKYALQTVYNQDPRTQEGELLFPSRFPADVVKRDKKVMGAYASAGQFQQRPAPRSGGLFKTSKIEIIEARPANLRLVRGWDLAGTSKAKNKNAAFTAGGLLGVTPGGEYVICDMVRDQLEPGGVETLIKTTASLDGYHVPGSIPQDPGQSGKAQVFSLIQQLAGYSYFSSPESGDKESRARPFAAQVEVGNVKMVRGPWNKDLIEEMSLFPNGKYKDQVDALSRGFAFLVTGASETVVTRYGIS